jgi:predicted metal-dependent hydrolase
MHTDPETARYDLTVRRFRLDADTLPKYWFDDNALLTHAINAQNLLFPTAERFMVRSVHRHLPQVEDPELRAAVRTFIGQEVQHGLTHDHALDLLRDQGFRIDGWLSGYAACIRAFERVAPAWLCLSITAATEHFTASVGECWLTEGRMPLAHPEMAAMLAWHAVEEIEHKAVAFDVLKAVEPRYDHRIVGLFLAAFLLLLTVVSATVLLLWQDPDATLARVRAERREAGKENIRSTRFIERHMGPYLARDFHPNDHDNLALAHAQLAELEAFLSERAA